jgi:hypothetical protein
LSITSIGLTVRLGPLGFANAVRLTVPLNPLRLESVTVDVTLDPAETVRLVGLGDRGKVGLKNSFIADALVSLVCRLCKFQLNSNVLRNE